MVILTQATGTQPDYIALAMVVALAVVVVIMVFRKKLSLKNKDAAVLAESAPVAEVTEQPLAPGSAGQIKLHGVASKTAAMLMAIVADKLVNFLFSE